MFGDSTKTVSNVLNTNATSSKGEKRPYERLLEDNCSIDARGSNNDHEVL